jgi:hypothetical protein
MDRLKELKKKEIDVNRLLKKSKDTVDVFEKINDEINFVSWEIKKTKEATEKDYEHIKWLIDDFITRYKYAVDLLNKDYYKIMKEFEKYLKIIKEEK